MYCTCSKLMSRKTFKKSIFCGFLKATQDPKPDADPYPLSSVRIQGSGYVPKCHESGALFVRNFHPQLPVYFLRSQYSAYNYLRLAYTPADTSPRNWKWRVTVIVYRPAWACTGALTIPTTWAGPSMEIGTRTTSLRFRYGTPRWTCLERPVGIWGCVSMTLSNGKLGASRVVPYQTISEVWLYAFHAEVPSHQNLLSLPASPLVFLDAMKNFEWCT
jgi:hypothetical protein